MSEQLHPSRASRSAAAAVLLLALAACGQQQQTSAAATEVRAAWAASLPSGPDDAAWKQVPVHTAKLIPQDLVEPRLITPTTPWVEAQAVCDGQRIAFRLSWEDATRDDVPRTAQFADACAVQLPERIEADAPSPTMGEAGRPVLLTYWSAFFQAAVDGRSDDIRALYPNALIDHYPFEAASLVPGSPEQQAMALRYAPARALGNTQSGPREQPVEDLMADGPGTLRPSGRSVSTGAGRHANGRWTVQITRPLPAGAAPGQQTLLALAVWAGANHEVGSRKMRTGWIPLALEPRP